MTVQTISGLQIRQDVGVERDWVFLGSSDGGSTGTTTFIPDQQRLKGPIFASTQFDDAIVRIVTGPIAGFRTTVDRVDPDNGGLVVSPALPTFSFAGAGVTYAATTLTDGSQAWTVGQWIGFVVTAGASTAVVTANTATVITVASWTGGTPANGTAYVISGLGQGNQYEVWLKGVNPDVLDRERDFALQRICSMWRPNPVTLITDGDYESPMTDVTHFAGTNATPTKQYSNFPDAHFRRILRVTNSGANGYVATDEMLTKTGELWFLEVPVSAYRANNDNGTAQIQIFDMTHNQIIGSVGGLTQVNGGTTGVSIGKGWGYISLLFTTPANCNRLQIRLGGADADAITDYGPINCHRYNHTRIGLPDRITTKKRVGSLYVTTQLLSASIQIWDFRAKLQSWHNWNRQQVGNRVEIWGTPPMANLAYFYMERGYFDALQSTTDYYTQAGRNSGDTNTTDCPKEYIEAAVAERMSKLMMKKFPGDPEWQAQWVQDSTELNYWEGQFGPEPKFIFENEEPWRVLQLSI